MEKLRLYDQPINRRRLLIGGVGASLLLHGCSVAELFKPGPIDIDDRILLPQNFKIPPQEVLEDLTKDKAAIWQIIREYNPESEFTLVGSASFCKGINDGLYFMIENASLFFAPIAAYVTEIRQGAANYSWGGRTDISISEHSATYSKTYAGSIVLHEAIHVGNWEANNQPVFGIVGEAKSLGVQANYLEAVGDKKKADWVRSLIGTWV